jgi:hypothetical protein
VQLQELSQALYTASPDELKIMLQDILAEYTPALSSGNHSLKAVAPTAGAIGLSPHQPWNDRPNSRVPLAA